MKLAISTTRLSLALWISGNEAFIFEVELNFLPRLAELQWFGLASATLRDAACLAQNLPDRRLGARQAHTRLLERRIAVEVIQDRFRPRDALQALRRGHSNLQDALHDG